MVVVVVVKVVVVVVVFFKMKMLLPIEMLFFLVKFAASWSVECTMCKHHFCLRQLPGSVNQNLFTNKFLPPV